MQRAYVVLFAISAIGFAPLEVYSIAPETSATENDIFTAPARVCIYTEIDKKVKDTLIDRNDPSLASIVSGDLSSPIKSILTSSLLRDGIALYDKHGSPIVSSFSSKEEAMASCSVDGSSVLVALEVKLKSNENPYKLIGRLTQASKSISSTISREALNIIEEYERNGGPRPRSDKPPALRPGPPVSVDGDTDELFNDLLKNIRWRK